MSRRVLLFALLCVACFGVAGFAVASAALRAQQDERESERAAVARPTIARLLADKRPFVLFRSLDRTDGSKYGRIALAPLDDGRAGARLLAGEKCDRIDLAGGRGLRLAPPTPAGFTAKILDASLRETGSVRLAGVPSRARISPNGR